MRYPWYTITICLRIELQSSSVHMYSGLYGSVSWQGTQFHASDLSEENVVPGLL